MRECSCAICLNRDGYGCLTEPYPGFDADFFSCDVCGRFVVSRTALVDILREDNSNMMLMQRAVLSHHVRLQNTTAQFKQMWTTDRLDRFFVTVPRLPNPSQQATNIIRLVGDNVIRSGTPIQQLPPSLPAEVGSPTMSFAVNLLVQLQERSLLNATVTHTLASMCVEEISLTLAGWEVFEKERQGQIAGNYGFVALKFGDTILDPLLQNHIKPAVREIGYELVDLRDVARAGIIDNILRMQIRDSAFVLVDLTHENAGAYWEAGYAEGLGKPVLYMCEREKFEEKKTHFDTSHCTTILWHSSNIEMFRIELIATIRRSLTK